MNRTGSFAGLMFLTVLAAGAPAESLPSSTDTAAVRIARIHARGTRDLRLVPRAIPEAALPLASVPPDEERRNAGSLSVGDFSGGSLGSFLIGAALAAAVGLLLAVVVPWGSS